tara:strand:- start:532 stop:1389 length:858 start_codon:yes stop_codon:yes gene_type:complete
MKIVDAIMAGMSRAGTTFMYHNLQKHPQIFLPSRKEIGFFAHNYNKGIEWYKSFFLDRKNDQVALDICGVYFTHEKALERMKDLDENTKIILSIRDPYQWIYTFYQQYSNSFEMPTFKEFITQGCQIEREGEKLLIDYRDEKISKTIQEYLEVFKGRIMIYDFSYFEKEPLNVLKAFEEFLCVDGWFDEENFNNKKINASGRQRSEWFDKLLQKKGVVDLILKFFPKNLILYLREKRELKEAREINKISINEKYSSEDQKLVKEIFQKDHEFISNLFKDKSIKRF